MKASLKTYEEVANHCSSYLPSEDADVMTNSTAGNVNISCITCRHFTKDHYCDINLYDKIVRERNLAEVKEQ